MSVRRGPAIVLSLVLGAAALVLTPTAQASDGGAAKDASATVQLRDEYTEAKRRQCDGGSVVRLRITLRDNGRLETVSTVWSNDDDAWIWKLRHEGDLSDEGIVRARDVDLSFRIVRTMINLVGEDTVSFRAENSRTGEVCRVTESL